jgi:YesN/AraC family two-component response regulator
MVIACTGHVEDEYIKKAWRHQIDEVVSKPINIDIVKEILKEIIIT